MCMVSLYMLAILCCHTIDWDIFLRHWCLSQIYYYYYSHKEKTQQKKQENKIQQHNNNKKYNYVQLL